MKPISASNRSHIVSLLQSGHSTRAIATRIDVSQSTVARIAKCEREDRLKPRGGRPRLLTARDERRIVKMVDTGETSNAMEVQKRVETTASTHVSAQTVRRV